MKLVILIIFAFKLSVTWSEEIITPPDSLVTVKEISSGFQHTCVIDDVGVKCWGSNISNQSTPPQDLFFPRSLSAGSFHTCVLDLDGVKCWGSEMEKQSSIFQNIPNPQMVSSGGLHSCAIGDNEVTCWGSDICSIDNPDINLVNPRFVSVGMCYACAVDDEGVKCWGDNRYIPPLPQISLTNILEIGSGYVHSCVRADKGIQCWGLNSHGQVDSSKNSINPNFLSVGLTYNCIIVDEKVKCWGSNDYGESSVPESLIYPKLLSAGIDHTCAVDNQGVKCWGSNQYQKAPRLIKVRPEQINILTALPYKEIVGLTEYLEQSRKSLNIDTSGSFAQKLLSENRKAFNESVINKFIKLLDIPYVQEYLSKSKTQIYNNPSELIQLYESLGKGGFKREDGYVVNEEVRSLAEDYLRKTLEVSRDLLLPQGQRRIEQLLALSSHEFREQINLETFLFENMLESEHLRAHGTLTTYLKGILSTGE